MKKLLFTLTFLVAFVASTFAQDKVKIAVGYVGNEFKFDPNEAAEYLNGLWLDVDGKIVSKGGFRVGGVFIFLRPFDVTQLARMTCPVMPLPASAMSSASGFGVVGRDTDTCSCGALLSYKAGPVEPFATALFGFRNPTDVSTRHF